MARLLSRMDICCKGKFILFTAKSQVVDPWHSPSKPTLFQFQVTHEDIVRNTTISRPATNKETRRDTWPVSGKPKRPGGYSFDAAPQLVKTPWELDRSKRSGRPQTSDRRPFRKCKFEELPKGVVLCVLDHLKLLHSSRSTINLKPYQTDLRALCTLNKHWHRLAGESLYQEIWLPRHEEPYKNALSFRKQQSRLQLLLRTLKESPVIAGAVKHLRISAALARDLELESLPNRQAPSDTSMQLLQEIISFCRNLEVVSSYAPMTLASNTDLFQALSWCTRLKSHAWRIPPADFNAYAIEFSKFHTSTAFNALETLLICQPPDGCGTVPGTISAVIQRLPSLRYLALQNLSASDFHNGTLLSLPALQSLRLEEVHGVTDQGIEQLAHARLSMSLERLILMGLELTSLQTLQTLLASLTRLRALTLVQKTSPEISNALSVTGFSSNFSLASNSVIYLHWDVLTRGSSIVTLANSIAAGKFPRLRKVKVPCDEGGVIQGLCRPIALQAITEEDMEALEDFERSPNYERSLRVAQIQAQLRVRKHRKQPSFKFVVQDDEEATKQTRVIGSYLGNVASSIEYSLDEAIEGTGSAIARVEDVVTPQRTPGAAKLKRGEEYTLDLSDLF